MKIPRLNSASTPIRSGLLTVRLAAAACVIAASTVAHAAQATAAAVVSWDTVPSILARIKAPTFANKDFPITDFGAKGDGTTDCTAAIRQAIAACNAAGGGRVLVTGGTFLTGAIHLKSNVNLHVAEGATLKFSADPAQFLPVVYTRFEGTECMNYSPLIYAWQQENIAITGKGTLDGSATRETWWALTRRQAAPGSSGQGQPLLGTRDLIAMGDKGVPVEQRIFGDRGVLRPNFIQPYHCRNILIEDVRIINSPMWEIHPVLSSNITIRGVNVSSHGPNNDGCDPESCRDVLIENCVFDTGDDCIAIKSGKNADGRRVGVASENLIIRGCTMKDGHGGVVLGSEVSGGVRNVFAENCTMDSPNLQRALRLKTNAERGGIIENVFFRNVQIGRVSDSILTIDLVYGRVTKGDFPPTVRNVFMEKVTSTSSPRVLSVVGTETSTIANINVADSTFRGVEGADVLTNAGSVLYRGVTVVPAPREKKAGAAPAGEDK